jgi:hypothetical protein
MTIKFSKNDKYKLKITGTFENNFRKLNVETRRRIDSTARLLETDPYLSDLAD